MSSIQPENLCKLLHAEVYDSSRDTSGAARENEGDNGGADVACVEGIGLSSKELQGISRLVGIICLGVHANFNWLNAREPNVEAARLTATRLVAQTQDLRAMVGRLRPCTCDQ